MTKGLLVRVAIDSTSGGWNAPCTDRDFCYVPMGVSELTENYDRGYAAYRKAVERLLPPSASAAVRFPRRLPREAHFDPDFEQLTYGDGGQRAARIKDFLSTGSDNFIVFYAGLRSVQTTKLIYSIIGFFAIDRVVDAQLVPCADWHRNAHTRPNGCADGGQIVVFAKRGQSGRLIEHIPIGEYRRRAYRVTEKLLDEWGNLDVRDGYIQRSAFLPSFNDAKRFLRWFRNQRPSMIARDNP